ncbi:MAG: pyridoxamine 5'-phosphate oxidase [Verrucomicrobiae bacterium]|nr:pyridoxamine 5'-phosphate oxidase [Verrucomicrobiae bacterium]
MWLSHLRREYGLGALERKDLAPDPIAQFEKWFDQAARGRGQTWLRRVGIALYKLGQAILGRAPEEVNAMVLATAGKSGRPSARFVLLKGFDHRGFIFFTNYDSRKGRELTENPEATLVFYWPDLERQVCISGTATKLSREESEAYFRTRPRGSQIAAWASPQSEVIPDRAALERRWAEFAAKFEGTEVPLPPNWGGYLLEPREIEFWQGRANRLHDRFRYTKTGSNHWQIEQLAP